MTQVLLPPAILAPLALLLCLAGLRRLPTALLLLLLLMATSAWSAWLQTRLAAPAPHASGPAQAVLIWPGPQSVSEQVARPALLLLRTGAALARHTGLPVLVAGSADPRSDVPDASQMAASLQQDFHIAASWIVSDATDPWRVAAASAATLRPAAIGTVYLVTTPWQRGLSTELLRRAGIAAVPLPRLELQRAPLGPLDFLPILSALVDGSDAVRALAERARDALRAPLGQSGESGRG